jgi:hypothetical protein
MFPQGGPLMGNIFNLDRDVPAGLKLPALAALQVHGKADLEAGLELALRPCIATAHLRMSFGKPSR